jgi:RHS repeat-associated protein
MQLGDIRAGPYLDPRAILTLAERLSLSNSCNKTEIYDAFGPMIEKSVGGATTLFMYDQTGHLLGEYSGSGNLIEETIWLDNLPVATIQPNGSTVSVYYVHADQIGAPRIITRPTDNAVMWRWDRDPFGTAAPNQNPQSLGTFSYNLRFPGQYFNQETGFNYNDNRDFDSTIGRYRQSDPIGLSGGIGTYTYVENSPLLHLDPRGLCDDDEPNLAIDNSGGLRNLAKWAQNNPGQALAVFFTAITLPAAARVAQPLKPQRAPKQG